MLAPFFFLSAYNHVNHYPLTKEHLPFIKCQNDHLGDVYESIDEEHSQDGEIRGGTSQVYMVWIHPDHHDFHQNNRHKLDPGRGFAIKKLEDENRDVNDKKGILKITDFGQAELHSKTSKTYRRSKGFDTLTYRSPECDTPPQLIRQSSDIWSLGCILLEFMTWMLGGAKYLDDFKRSRLLLDQHVNPIKTDIFWERVPLGKLDHVGTRLKPAVSKHIEELRSHQNCSPYVQDVLDLIVDMLVIEPSHSYDNQARRKTCGEVMVCLKNLSKKCQEPDFGVFYAIGNIPKK
ncbi:protein kinase [Colletotrichum higginsianum]|uniref:Protein kinase n=1 Tax=Colletotrichum higginsianum (strain IMI 349063) TaxID=759273 RepID=H1UW23_COLHI|nr:Protein kinase [Colletotrichum higginsianum IMI 349063]OBR05703.1 Protein kinase [Colletotrichum higginsianum IMI 349063]CCF32174.1 protein kinase [Colletotrichum higginsianum]